MTGMQWLTVIMLIISASFGFAQPVSLKVSGHITRLEDGKSLKRSQVVMEIQATKQSKTKVAPSGHYKLEIPYDQKIMLIFSAEGYATKKIEIDTQNIPDSKRRGLRMKVDVDLFPDIPGFDHRVLKDPISKGSYKHATNTMGWDTDYYRLRLQQIEAERARALEENRK